MADSSGKSGGGTGGEEIRTSARQSSYNKKRRLSPTTQLMSGNNDAVVTLSPTVLAAMLQVSQKGFPGFHSLLLGQHGSVVPTEAQIAQAATKAAQETPPFVHLSKTDSAPQLTIEDYLTVKGGMRGYRMSRASHGVSEGTYYFECHILEPPKVQDLVKQLPPNVRLGPKLQKQLQKALSEDESDFVCGHSRIGWSMRTGDLQAPVGYDKWSYGYRDQSGSRVHASQREDLWGAKPYGVGDVVGFMISLEGSDDMNDTSENHIRFFRNGDNMGHYVVTRGKREGGVAFEDIPHGTYYPAISVYLGASVHVNFGPHFCYPPRKLPSNYKKWQPVSNLCEPPLEPSKDVLMAHMKKHWPGGSSMKKVDDTLLQTLLNLLKKEAQIRQEAYKRHFEANMETLRKAREARKLSTNDLVLGEEGV